MYDFIKLLIKLFVSKNLIIIVVYIWWGDYKNEWNVKYGYNLVIGEYFSRVFKYFRDRYDFIVFIVFINLNVEDFKWCKYYVNGSDVVFVLENLWEVDMCVILMCNYIIMMVGFFGWWGSFLVKGIIIYFSDVV